jgi:hypothetical protein
MKFSKKDFEDIKKQIDKWDKALFYRKNKMTVRDYHKQIENGIEYTVATEGGHTQWYINQKLHRESGAAYIYEYSGVSIMKWFLDGEEIPFEFYSIEEYERKRKLLAFW